MKNMKKYAIILSLLLAFTTLLTGCHNPNDILESSNNTVTAAYASYLVDATAGTFSSTATGVVSGNNITFTYTGAASTALVITKMRIWLTIPNTSIVTPSLTGLKDMTNPLTITVTAGDGSQKSYTVTVVKQ